MRTGSELERGARRGARARVFTHFGWVGRAIAHALLALGLGGAAGAAESLEPAPEGVSGSELARRAEDNLRSVRTFFSGRMTIESPRLMAPREVAFESWEDKEEKRSLIEISAPAKDAGTRFLKLHPNLWTYIPRVERTMRVPPSMMLQSWMGSDFTNDDLVRESSDVDDYDHRVLGVDPDADGEGAAAYVVEYLPHEDAPVVWGRIVAWLDRETGASLRQEYYDEEGSKLRVLRFEDFRAQGERSVPHRWILTPLEKPGHRTVILVDEIRYDGDFDDSMFTLRYLKRAGGRR